MALSKNTRGNKHLAMRSCPDLHAKVKRVGEATGCDKSAVLRTALEFLSEQQLVGLVLAQRGQQQSVAVQHAP